MLTMSLMEVNDLVNYPLNVIDHLDSEHFTPIRIQISSSNLESRNIREHLKSPASLDIFSRSEETS